MKFKQDLIDLETKVLDSSNKSSVGLHGKITKETKNMLMIETEKGEKKIQKKGTIFMFMIDNKKLKVDGSILVGRPEKRKSVKKW